MRKNRILTILIAIVVMLLVNQNLVKADEISPSFGKLPWQASIEEVNQVVMSTFENVEVFENNTETQGRGLYPYESFGSQFAYTLNWFDYNWQLLCNYDDNNKLMQILLFESIALDSNEVTDDNSDKLWARLVKQFKNKYGQGIVKIEKFEDSMYIKSWVVSNKDVEIVVNIDHTDCGGVSIEYNHRSYYSWRVRMKAEIDKAKHDKDKKDKDMM